MAVVVPLELHHLVPPREPARGADGAHGALGPGVHEPEPLHRRVDPLDRLGEVDLERARGAEAAPPRGLLRDGRRDGLGRVAEQERTERQDVVDVPIPIDVHEVRPLSPLDKPGGAADGLERPYGRRDAAGHEGLGVGEKLFGAGGRAEVSHRSKCARSELAAASAPAITSGRPMPRRAAPARASPGWRAVAASTAATRSRWPRV